jgi:hypothetical protein
MDLTYERTENFDGELAKAIEIVRNTLLPHGFEIIQCNESYMEVANNTFTWGRQPNPIKMISSASISLNGDKITLQAELGGVKKLILYVSLFIIGMAAFFLVTFGILFGLIQHQPMSKIALLSLTPLAPWPVIIPLMSIWFKNSAKKALDTLMNNMLSTVQSSGNEKFVRKYPF